MLLFEYDGKGNIKTRYALGSRADEVISKKAYRDEDGESFDKPKIMYYHYDALGSTRQLTDENRKVVAEYTYDAWGNVLASTDATGNAYTFTGEQSDTDASLLFLRLRYYDPTTGRFISKDILPFVNRYIYVSNNPVNKTDPRGLHPIPGREWIPYGIRYHTQCLDEHQHVWTGTSWRREKCRAIFGAGSAEECVHGTYWSCVAHCEMRVLIGQIATSGGLAGLKAVVNQAAKGVAKKWALKGIPVVGQLSTVYSAGQAIKCLVDCKELKH